jgi:hypothetical protein
MVVEGQDKVPSVIELVADFSSPRNKVGGYDGGG